MASAAGPFFSATSGIRDLQEQRPPLPQKVRRLREESFSVFVFELPQQITKTDLGAMFYRAGKIIDSFLPVDQEGRKWGFAFVRFATCWEAEKAVNLAVGRSQGGRKLQVNLARFGSM